MHELGIRSCECGEAAEEITQALHVHESFMNNKNDLYDLQLS